MDAASKFDMTGLGHLVIEVMDNYNINAASQLCMASLGPLVIVSNGQLSHKCSISAAHGWSGSFCNCI